MQVVGIAQHEVEEELGQVELHQYALVHGLAQQPPLELKVEQVVGRHQPRVRVGVQRAFRSGPPQPKLWVERLLAALQQKLLEHPAPVNARLCEALGVDELDLQARLEMLIFGAQRLERISVLVAAPDLDANAPLVPRHHRGVVLVQKVVEDQHAVLEPHGLWEALKDALDARAGQLGAQRDAAPRVPVFVLAVLLALHLHPVVLGAASLVLELRVGVLTVGQVGH
mmetsp:Transcript_15027/g.47818  ORF Transcript_15027/g.47818 Transcript_15027/m.47818 type:complete len:226 (+) Transcript_15027:1013-1690(+)